MNLSRRLLRSALIAILPGFLTFHLATRDPRPSEQGVAESADEGLYTARIVAAAVAAANDAQVGGRPVGRSSHAKAHGCVRATLSVPALEPRLRHGLLSQPRDYDAWIRFSSGEARARSDQFRDVRGFALKVMGVAGEKLLPHERDARTQDFVLSDSPRFFVSSVREYTELIEAMRRGSRLRWFFADSVLPWRWRVRSAWLVWRARRAPPSSLLQTRYYSATAYRLGADAYVKYAVWPCAARRSPRQNRTEDMLRSGLREELSLGPACFELGVQLQVAGRNMPVEDASVLWSEKDSPFLPVARITIPKQRLDDPARERLCEDLSFHPWRSLPEHEPVGALNRVRRAVYTELSRYRHARNGTRGVEPCEACTDETSAPDAAGVGETVPLPAPSPSASPTAAAGSSPSPAASPRAARRPKAPTPPLEAASHEASGSGPPPPSVAPAEPPPSQPASEPPSDPPQDPAP